MKKLFTVLKIVVWLIVTFFLAMLYFAFYGGFFDAIESGDLPNILGIPPFIGVFTLVHYGLLWVLNYFTYRDYFIGFRLFPWLKEQGTGKATMIALPIILLSFSSIVVIPLHLYYTLVVFGILDAREKRYPHIPYKPVATTQKQTTTTTTTTTTSTKSPEVSTAKKEYNFDAYQRFIKGSLTASTIRVDYGFTKFIGSAKVSSLSLTVSGGSTPRVSATATVTLYKNRSAITSYVGVASHHNNPHVNQNVVDSEISSAVSRAKDAVRSAIEDKIRSLTRNFAASNGGGPDSVNESVSVSVIKA